MLTGRRGKCHIKTNGTGKVLVVSLDGSLKGTAWENHGRVYRLFNGKRITEPKGASLSGAVKRLVSEMHAFMRQ